MPLTTYFRTRYGYRHGDFPAADDIFARALALPLHDGLTEDQQATVVAELRKVLGD
jgi:dTDP-4-amino-4,6-dideoxygalactose transaminase